MSVFQVSLEDCRLIVEEFEPSPIRRANCQLSKEGFTRFFMFSDMVNIVDPTKLETVYMVIRYACLRRFRSYTFPPTLRT